MATQRVWALLSEVSRRYFGRGYPTLVSEFGALGEAVAPESLVACADAARRLFADLRRKHVVVSPTPSEAVSQLASFVPQ